MKRTISRLDRSRLLALTFSLVLIVAVLAQSAPTSANGTGLIQIVMVLDGSGSISAASWSIITQGVADAITNNLPHDGSVEFTLVQFGYPSPTLAKVEVPPTIITSSNYAAIATTIAGLSQGGSMTPMAHGLYLGWKTVKSSTNFSLASKQIINLATDGVPNVRNNNATTDLDGSGGVDYYDDVIAVVLNAVGDGLEELDIEGIAISDTARDWFKSYVVWPQPGHIAPPYTAGWIRVVANADEFATAVREKFTIVSGPPPVGGTIASTPFSDMGLPLLLAMATVIAASVVVAGRRYRV